jgi:hypothetical protein
MIVSYLLNMGTRSGISMMITIDLTPEEERKLEQRATRKGQDVTAYVHRLIERDIADVEEALAPFRREVVESQISDDELRAVFQEIREEVWQHKQGRSSSAS